MKDLFMEKNVEPMLIAQMQPPFDDPDWIYELKLDGIRCIAYLGNDGVILRNKRNRELLPRFPELQGIHEQVKGRCVLDGELVVLVNSAPDFYELQKRTMLTGKSKIEIGAGRHPASFVAYDCLQYGKKVLSEVPLMERKKILNDLIATENERFAISRYIAEKGTQLFQMTVERKLEGVVAKRAESLYFMGKRTKDWVKFKRMADKEFVICGYVSGKMTSLIFGENDGKGLKYAGAVTMGVRKEILHLLKKSDCPFASEPEKQGVIWCKPEYVCTVEYMPNTLNVLRQPVFKGLRDDV